MVARPPELPSSAQLVTRPPERMQQRRLHPLPLPTIQQIHIQIRILAIMVSLVMRLGMPACAQLSIVTAVMSTTVWVQQRRHRVGHGRRSSSKIMTMLLTKLPTIRLTIVLQVLQVRHLGTMPTMAMAPLVMPLEGPARAVKSGRSGVGVNRPLLCRPCRSGSPKRDLL